MFCFFMFKLFVRLLKQRDIGDDRLKSNLFMRDLKGTVKRGGERERRVLLNWPRKILVNEGKVIARQEE